MQRINTLTITSASPWHLRIRHLARAPLPNRLEIWREPLLTLQHTITAPLIINYSPTPPRSLASPAPPNSKPSPSTVAVAFCLMPDDVLGVLQLTTLPLSFIIWVYCRIYVCTICAMSLCAGSIRPMNPSKCLVMAEGRCPCGHAQTYFFLGAIRPQANVYRNMHIYRN
jgi:hypothetical protein